MLFLCAFFLRALFLPLFADVYFDSGRMMSQYELASNIADGKGFVHNPSFMLNAPHYNATNKRNTDFKLLQQSLSWDRDAATVSPEIDDVWGYAFLLGHIWKVTHDKSYLYIQVFQIVIDSIACVMIFASVVMLFHSRRYAYAASIAYMCFVPFIFMSDIANRDYFAAWGLIYSLFLFMCALARDNSVRYFLCSGLAIALFSWFRPTILLVTLIYAFYFWLKAGPTLKGVLASARVGALMMCLPLLLFVLPFALLFHQKYGTYDFAAISGVGLWEGMGEAKNSYGFQCSDSAARERAWQLGYPRNDRGLKPQLGRLLREDALRVIHSDPMFYLRACGRRYIESVFLNVPFGISEKFQISYWAANMSPREFVTRHPFIAIEKALKLILRAALPLLAVLALLVLRGYLREVLLLLSIWQYKIFAHVGTHFEVRFVMEGYFPVVVLSAVVVVILWEEWRKRVGAHGRACNARLGPRAL
jgi:hypothetical protein